MSQGNFGYESSVDNRVDPSLAQVLSGTGSFPGSGVSMGPRVTSPAWDPRCASGNTFGRMIRRPCRIQVGLRGHPTPKGEVPPEPDEDGQGRRGWGVASSPPYRTLRRRPISDCVSCGGGPPAPRNAHSGADRFLEGPPPPCATATRFAGNNEHLRAIIYYCPQALSFCIPSPPILLHLSRTPTH